MGKRKLGTSTGGIETSAKWKRRQARKLRQQEREWAAKSGPVISTRMIPPGRSPDELS